MAETARRAFFVRLLQSAGLAATAGFLWSALVRQEARAMPLALRPPGALADDDFNALCIKCGQCVRDCPYRTLTLAAVGDPAPLGTPYFVPRQIPCYMCPDIPCKVACPTGALSGELDSIEDSRMGLAVIDEESCLSWQGLRCEICHRVCPLIDRAISIEKHQRQISKHAMFVPIVHSEYCTGCGLCENACPTEVAAIRVLPHHLVQGRIGQHYRLGWKIDTPITQEYAPHRPGAPAAAPEAVPGLDYLNEDFPR